MRREQLINRENSAFLSTPIGLAKYERGDNYLVAKHLLFIDKSIRTMLAGNSRNLMIMMPPRHGKSELCSHYLPAWHLMMHPSKRVILTSYAAEFAASWGRRIRATIENCGSAYGVDLDPRSAAADRFDILGYDGGLITAGVGGQITGRGADLLIIDDPVKNAQDAMSKTVRDTAWDWYRSTAYTRLEPNAKIVLIMTRWHDDDLAGRILKTASDEWDIIRLPALAETKDVLGRRVGEPLWEQRYSAARLETIRQSIGEYYWSALYQQTPVDVENAIFKQSWLNKALSYIPPQRDRIYRAMYCDLAASDTVTADYTAVAIMSRDIEDGTIYIECVSRERASWAQAKRFIVEVAARWQPDVIGIESGGVQKALAEDLMRDPELMMFRIIADQPIGDKVTRAMPLAARVEAGTVRIIDGDYVLDLFAELAVFPRGQHDDQVDALTGAYKLLTETDTVRIW